MRATLRVLYAEDNAADADLTKAHFDRHAPEIVLDVVTTGERCLARLEENRHDVVLLDNRLPDMEGVDVLKELTANDVAVPVVIVTAVGDEELVVQALRLGAWDYIPKHGNYVESLPAVLRNAANEYRWRQKLGMSVRQRQRRLLYVERHPADIDLTLQHFAEAAPHFNVDVVQTSKDALALLHDHLFDLVLTDLRMPDMSALDLLREARRQGVTVPFIIITGQGDENAAVASLRLGALDYIVKRDNYLIQLPYAIDHAIARFELVQMNRRLQAELTERERLGFDNARLLAEARQALEARDEFLSVAAHEIRGPLMAMRLAVQGLRKGSVPAEAVPGVLDIIEHEDRKLAQFVEELLDLGRIRTGTLSLVVETIDLRDVVREVVARSVGELTRSGSSVSVSCTGNPVGQWDRSRMDRIVSTLLHNASRYGLGQPIELAIIADHASVQFLVTDRGPGISKEMQERIFRPFEGESSVRTYGGLGLGLYLVRAITHALGGNVTLKSEPGAGSTFIVELPRMRDF